MSAINKTVFLAFDNTKTSSSASIVVNPLIHKIIFRSLSYNGAVDEYAVLQSDLIQGESIGIVFRNNEFSNSTAQVVEYHFTQPTKISGTYNFVLKKLDGTTVTLGANEKCVFIAEFVYDDDKIHH
jgi:hypothetical protein